VWAIRKVLEKPKPTATQSRLSLPGRYVFSSEIFDSLRRCTPGRNGEIQLTDGIEDLARQRGVDAIRCNANRWDTGNRSGYFEAMIAFALERPDFQDEAKRILKKTMEGRR
jgi:UTP--glucose-1-phosphate uridylyltransferase